MSKYKVITTSGDEIIISEEEKKEVDRLWKNKLYSVISIKGNTVSTKFIRSIIEIPEMSLASFSKKNEEIDRLFFQELDQLSQQIPRDKAIREMKKRISPGLKLSGIKSGGDKIVQSLYKIVLEFHTVNPHWPWCPTEVWWNEIKPHIKDNLHVSRWFMYVFKSDGQIERWYKRKHGTIVIVPVSNGLLPA